MDSPSLIQCHMRAIKPTGAALFIEPLRLIFVALNNFYFIVFGNIDTHTLWLLMVILQPKQEFYTLYHKWF